MNIKINEGNDGKALESWNMLTIGGNRVRLPGGGNVPPERNCQDQETGNPQKDEKD